MAKELITAGANPNFKDANEQTVMFYCCRDGKRKLTEYLLSVGMKLDEEDLYGQTPLYYVASENRMNLLDFFTLPSTFPVILSDQPRGQVGQTDPTLLRSKEGSPPDVSISDREGM
jgi:hypothetical protein